LLNELSKIALYQQFSALEKTTAAYRIRRSGARYDQVVYVNPARHPDARAALEEKLGALDRFEPLAATAKPAADRKDEARVFTAHERLTLPRLPVFVAFGDDMDEVFARDRAWFLFGRAIEEYLSFIEKLAA
jgi:hypothetical protein